MAEDGTVVDARTMEFSIDIHCDLIMVPRGYSRIGSTPDGKEGFKWKAKYASVGLNGVGKPFLFDGLNEKGLAAGLFYFPTSAEYMAYAAADAGRIEAPASVSAAGGVTPGITGSARRAVATASTSGIPEAHSRGTSGQRRYQLRRPGATSPGS